jgi:hypothetical protein
MTAKRKLKRLKVEAAEGDNVYYPHYRWHARVKLPSGRFLYLFSRHQRISGVTNTFLGDLDWNVMPDVDSAWLLHRGANSHGYFKDPPELIEEAAKDLLAVGSLLGVL